MNQKLNYEFHCIGYLKRLEMFLLVSRIVLFLNLLHFGIIHYSNICLFKNRIIPTYMLLSALTFHFIIEKWKSVQWFFSSRQGEKRANHQNHYISKHRRIWIRRTRSIFHCFEWIHGVLNVVSRVNSSMPLLISSNYILKFCD